MFLRLVSDVNFGESVRHAGIGDTGESAHMFFRWPLILLFDSEIWLNIIATRVPSAPKEIGRMDRQRYLPYGHSNFCHAIRSCSWPMR